MLTVYCPYSVILTWLIPVSVRQDNGCSFVREDSGVSLGSPGQLF